MTGQPEQLQPDRWEAEGPSDQQWQPVLPHQQQNQQQQTSQQQQMNQHQMHQQHWQNQHQLQQQQQVHQDGSGWSSDQAGWVAEQAGRVPEQAGWVPEQAGRVNEQTADWAPEQGGRAPEQADWAPEHSGWPANDAIWPTDSGTWAAENGTWPPDNGTWAPDGRSWIPDRETWEAGRQARTPDQTTGPRDDSVLAAGESVWTPRQGDYQQRPAEVYQEPGAPRYQQQARDRYPDRSPRGDWRPSQAAAPDAATPGGAAVRGAPPGGAEQGTAGVHRRLSPSNDRDEDWAVLSYVGAVLLNFVPPLAIYLVKGKDSAFLRAHAAQALNVAVTAWLYTFSMAIVAGLLALDSRGAALRIGLVGGVAIWLATLSYLTRAAIAARDGKFYSVPRWLCAPLLRP